MSGSAFPQVHIRYVAKTGTGHTPARTRPELWRREECLIPWFTLGDVWQLRDGGRTVVEETAERISSAGLASSAAVLHPAGTVLLSRTASVGFSAVMGVDMAVSQDFMTWTPGRRLRSRFLLWALRGMAPELRRLMYGSTHKTIYMPDLLALRIPLPPVTQQERIVAFLDQEGERIAALRHTATELAERLHAALEHERRRLPFLAERHTRLSWIADITFGFPFASERFSADEVRGRRVVRIRDLSGDAEAIYTRESAPQWAAIRSGDILIGMDGDFSVHEWSRGDALLNQRVARVRHRDAEATSFVRHAMVEPLARVHELKHATTVKHLSAPDIRSLPIPDLPTDAQRDLGARLDHTEQGVAESRAALRQVDARLLEYRDSLVAEVTTGRLVPGEVAESALEERARAALEGVLL